MKENAVRISQLNHIREIYLRQIFSDTFQMASKNSNCEENVNLHLPTKITYPHMYVYMDEFQKSYLKDPFLVYYEMDSYYNSWRLEYLNTISKYLLLICKYGTDSMCEDGRNEKHWILLVGCWFYCFTMN